MKQLLFSILLSSTCFGTLRADLNGDCRVDMADLYILMSEWMLQENCEMALGPELVVNGGFDTDTDWTKGDGWIISDGAAQNEQGIGSDLSQEIIVSSGKTYQFTTNVSGFMQEGGSLEVLLTGDPEGEQTIVLITAEQITEGITSIVEAVAGDGTILTYRATITAGGISMPSVSVREVLADGGVSGAEYMQGMLEDER